MSDAALARALALALSEKDPTGAPRFTRGAVRDVVALLSLWARPAPRSLPKPALELLGEFSVAIRAPLTGAGELQARLDEYFAQHPPDPELLSRVRRALGR